MSKKDKQGNWIDSRGAVVPAKYVNKIDKKRDKTVEMITKKAQKLREQMQKLKEDSIERLNQYIVFLEKEKRVERKGKGNLSLVNFSGEKKVEYSINDIIEFDEQLQLAKTIIDECLQRWSEGGNRNIQAIVSQAFNVDKKGQINKYAILKLRQLNIRDSEWKKAMDLISDSLKIAGSRQYLQVKTLENGNWKSINLNFSSI